MQRGQELGSILIYSLTPNCFAKNLIIEAKATKHRCFPRDYDEDCIVLPQRYDAIVSILSLHYSNDMIGSLIQYKKYLNDGGEFLAIILGGDTLKELKNCLIEVDERCFGKVYPRVMPMINPQTVPSLMQRAGHINSIISVEKVELEYESLKALCDDIKSAGQLNYLNDRSGAYVGKNYFPEVEKLYFERHQKNSKIIATFEFIVMHSKNRN